MRKSCQRSGLALTSIVSLALTLGAFGCTSGDTTITGGGSSGGASSGGSSGSSGSSGTSGQSSGASSGGSGAQGALYYGFAGTMVRLDLTTRQKISFPFQNGSQAWVGYGDGVFTDVQETDPSTDTFQVNLHVFQGAGFSASSMPGFSLNGLVESAAEPSSDGSRIALSTQESASIDDPVTNYVKVFDVNANTLAAFKGFSGPVWISAHTIVMSGDDGGVYVVDLDSNAAPRSIGASVLGGDVAVSPDGTTIAFVQDVSILYTVKLDGTGLTQLTLQQDGQHFPTWSPDGTTLALQFGGCSWTSSADIVMVSATVTNQDVTQAPLVGPGIEACGPMHWL